MVPLRRSGQLKTIKIGAVQRRLPGFSRKNETHRTARTVPLPFFNGLLG
jgi:hypothetical protein